MAKTKKVEVLTLEEKLQQALVPQEEQPYKVPDNWCWSRLETINLYKSVNIDPLKQENVLFELYSVPSSFNNYPEIIKGCEIGSIKQSVKKDDVLLCKINPRINRVWKVAQYTGNILIASSEWIVIRNHNINADYLLHCLRAPYFREYMLSNVSGVGGSLMRAQPKYVKTYPIPLPPLPEQQRIADRIESLFAKLDEAKEKAQEVVDGFEERKAAILHKAFTGELTSKWRAEHGIGMDSWEEIELGEVFALKAGKNIKANEISNIQKKDFVFPCFGGNGIRGYVNRYNKEGDIPIIGRQGALCGNINLAKGKFYATEHAVMVDYKKDCDTIFVVEYLKYLNLNKYATATAQPGLAVSNLMKIPIVYVAYNEQKILSKLLNRLLTEEQHAKEAAESVLEQVDLIKKSILAKAFRGELGTNNPGEESAVELLKACLQEQ